MKEINKLKERSGISGAKEIEKISNKDGENIGLVEAKAQGSAGCIH